MTVAVHDHLVAQVDGHELLLSEVEARLVQLRSGRLAAVLPSAATAEGRNMRRWVVQLCAAERIVRQECPSSEKETTTYKRLAVTAALQVGGIAAAILNRFPEALQLIPVVEVPDAEVRGYYERNRDLYPQPFEEVRSELAAELADHLRVTGFARWLDQAMRDRVVLEPGFEHPAEPGHPDSTHRH